MQSHRWLLMLTAFALLCAGLEAGIGGEHTWFIQLSGLLNILVPGALLWVAWRAGRGSLNGATGQTSAPR